MHPCMLSSKYLTNNIPSVEPVGRAITPRQRGNIGALALEKLEGYIV